MGEVAALRAGICGRVNHSYTPKCAINATSHFYSSIYFNSYCLGIRIIVPAIFENGSCIDASGNRALDVFWLRPIC